jgi:hypothetical protein
VLSNLGQIAGERGDYARAIEVTEEALALESSHKQNAAISREWLERTIASTLELGFKEVMAYALAAFARLFLLEGTPRVRRISPAWRTGC